MKLLLNKSKQSGSQLIEYLLIALMMFAVVTVAIGLYGTHIADALATIEDPLSSLGDIVDDLEDNFEDGFES